jgi:hypothetical protein
MGIEDLQTVQSTKDDDPSVLLDEKINELAGGDEKELKRLKGIKSTLMKKNNNDPQKAYDEFIMSEVNSPIKTDEFQGRIDTSGVNDKIPEDVMEQIEAMVEKLSKGKEADVEYFVNQATLLYKRQDESLNEDDKLKAVQVQIENIINSPTESKKEAVSYKGSAPVKPERNID